MLCTTGGNDHPIAEQSSPLRRGGTIPGPALPGAFKAPLNTKSLGMVLDRLSILALKIYYMKEQSHKRENRKKCTEKLKVLEQQRVELLEATKYLLVDFMNGARQPRAYYQHKMYNDPKLNPELSGKK